MTRVLFLFSLLTFLGINGNAQHPKWINYTTGNRIYAIAFEENTLWVGTEGGLMEFDITTGISVFYNKANSGLPRNNVTSIAIDHGENKWIGTSDGGLVKFDGEHWKTYNTTNSGMPGDYVTSLTIDGKGTK